ncbi:MULTISPECIES: BTAD domain-containing putative transcriptional regulator [unclassified Streptomyces]|uniref:AfsR/SARP family transcriptional regulator n=1 Tax=unclassified Streptomyces TaxID=2593676 RepID=UPI001BED078C|nr:MULTISPECIES: BTAD domain-containing putative transcriptional regulator [unclassified Streptomyces]MBT2408440.1 winged helix-turn-helix domain-containing protein [Streptomyces sp. ISL-21]MBT2454821.1 winged helix-turn-helix domain-containing protein [Streptomyces sp. ISL-86]MBT2610530.1 winged helix-turn-helix domain-containing protein [Streptomyces sp. ISL-87]
MEFRLLGPVEVVREGKSLALGGPKPRTLLAALMLARGRVVSVDRLVDQVWSEEPPSTARALVQTYVSSLRRALRVNGLLETRPPGYALHVPADRLDIALFEERAGQGRGALASGDPVRAAGLLREALSLWRGTALDGTGGALRGEAQHLAELRLTALEARTAADLALGRAGDLVGELSSLVAEAPLRERFRAQLISALYRTGRQSEALEVYHEGRRLLADELGVDPGPELRRLYELIVRGEPDTADPRTVSPPPESAPAGVPQPAPALPAPAQLPPAVRGFVGRDRELAALVGGLSAAEPVWLVSGSGGVGKSALAVHAAHRLARAYPDGQMYVDLRGTLGPSVPPGEAIGGFLRALGTPDAAIPEGLEARTARLRSELGGRQMLLVLDDAVDEAQIRPLLPGNPDCGVVITSRNRLAGLVGPNRIELGVLSDSAAVELLARTAGTDRVAEEPGAAAEVVRLCGNLPLAVRIAGARLATRSHWGLAALVDRLADERRRLDELRAGDLEVRSCFHLSFRALDPEARTAFARLGLLGVPDFAGWVLALLLDVPERVAEEVCERLVDSQLLEPFGHYADATAHSALQHTGTGYGTPVQPPRYRLHDLLRLYASEQAEGTQTMPERSAAMSRVLDGWLALVGRAAAAQPSGAVPPPTTRTVFPIAFQQAAAAATANPLAWFAVEERALVAAVEQAAALGLDTAACQLATALAASAYAVGNRFEQWDRVHATALAAARQAGNHAAEAGVLTGLGQLRYEEDRYTDAERHFRHALPLLESAGDTRGVAAVLSGLGSVNRERARFAVARDQLTRALHTFKDLGDHAGIGHTARLAASVYLEEGAYPAAHGLLAESLAAYRRIGSVRGEALALRTRGLVYRAAGDYRTASDLCAEAGIMFRRLDDRLMAAYADQALVKARIRLGETRSAGGILAAALRECVDHRDPLGEGLVLRTLGELALAEGDFIAAERHLMAAFRIWEGLDLPLFCARARRDLADVHEATGDHAAAARCREQALLVFAEFGAREYAELSARTAARAPRSS